MGLDELLNDISRRKLINFFIIVEIKTLA